MVFKSLNLVFFILFLTSVQTEGEQRLAVDAFNDCQSLFNFNNLDLI